MNISTAARVTVPSVRMRNIAIPVPLRELTRTGFRDSAWVADIDGNELLKSDPHGFDENRTPMLKGANLRTAISMLESGGKICYITGSMFDFQRQRTVDPIIAGLQSVEKVHLIQNVRLYGNRGASYGTYLEDGSIDGTAYSEYVDRYGIQESDISIIQETADRVIAEFWDKYRDDSDAFRKDFPKFNYIPPYFQIRDASMDGDTRLGAPQVAMLPFPGDDVLAGIVDRMTTLLPAEVKEKLSLSPGGGTTVDINKKGISKATAFEHIITEVLHIPVDSIESPLEHPIPYSGDETWRVLDHDGRERRGGDTFPLKIANCFLLGFDDDPSAVIKAPGRSFYMGRGPVANLAVRQWVVKNWGRLCGNAEVTVPFQEDVTLSPPAPMIFAKGSGFAGTLIGSSGSLITGFQHEKDIKEARIDDTALQIAEHLRLGKPFVIASGGDYTNRLIPMLDAIRFVCGFHKERMRNLLAFSNNGAMGLGFKANGAKMPLWSPDSRSIKKEHVEALSNIGTRIIEEYKRKFPDALEEPELQLRQFDGNVLQITLLPFDPQTRGWIMHRFQEMLDANTELNSLYSGQFGGHSFDIGLKGNTKEFCIRRAMEHFKLPGNAPVIYFGGQFFSDIDVTGLTINGVDMSTLKLGNLFPVALNDDQDTVPEQSRIFQGGSGGKALATWLEYLHSNG